MTLEHVRILRYALRLFPNEAHTITITRRPWWRMWCSVHYIREWSCAIA